MSCRGCILDAAGFQQPYPTSKPKYYISSFMNSHFSGFDSEMVFLTNDKKLTEEKDMVLLGIRTQTHVIDVGLHFCHSGNQLLYKRSAPQYVQNFGSSVCGVSYLKKHYLQFKHTTRGYKGQQFLSCGG